MFENNLLSQVNIQSPLPTFVETEVIDNISGSLHRAFVFAHNMLAEKSDKVAMLLPYSSELYFILRGLLDRTILYHANATFVELLFGLRRCTLTGPASHSPVTLSYLLSHENSSTDSDKLLNVSGSIFHKWMCYLRYMLFGPSPMPTAEQRAIDYVNNPESRNYSDNNNNNITTTTTTTTTNNNNSTKEMEEANVHVNTFHTSSELSSTAAVDDNMNNLQDSTHSELSAEELHSANQTPYGYLRFKPLNRIQRLLSVLLLSLKPYCDMKLMEWYNAQVDDSADAVMMRAAYKLQHPHRAALKEWIARYVVPIYHVISKTTELMYKLAYVFELTPFTSLPHRLCGVVLRRSNLHDQLIPLSKRAGHVLLLARVLFLLIFAGFRLLDYSRSGMNSSGTVGGTLGEDDLPIPPAPQWGIDVPEWNESTNVITDGNARLVKNIIDNHDDIDGNNSNNKNKNNDNNNSGSKVKKLVMPTPEPGKCAVCRKRVTNAAVCTSSGIVGCYPCLQSYIREYHVCPVTQKSTSVEQIRRIYES